MKDRNLVASGHQFFNQKPAYKLGTSDNEDPLGCRLPILAKRNLVQHTM